MYKMAKRVFLTDQVSVSEVSYSYRKKLSVYQKKSLLHRKKVSEIQKFLSQKKFPSENSFHHRNKLMSEFPSEIQISVIERKILLQEKKFFHRKKILPQTKVSVKGKKILSQKQVDRNLIYQDIVLSSPKGKCVKK